MNREVFNRHWLALVKAYLYAEKSVDVETQDVYWEMLKGIPEDKFIHGVRHCLATCKFFPTIAELGEASLPKVTRVLKAPYNPYRYTKPTVLEIDWQKQINEGPVTIAGRLKVTPR